MIQVAQYQLADGEIAPRRKCVPGDICMNVDSEHGKHWLQWTTFPPMFELNYEHRMPLS